MKNYFRRLGMYLLVLVSLCLICAPSAANAQGVAVGSVVKFGSCMQDYNGKEMPIEWLVLQNQKGNLLLISRYGLDVRTFCNNERGASWQNSDLRTWLNGVFMKNSFSPAEMKSLLKTSVSSETGYARESVVTDDFVYLLNVDEVRQLMPNEAERLCEPTAYAVRAGAKMKNGRSASWWLRSLGEDNDEVMIVNRRGRIDYEGEDADEFGVCVRPVIRVPASVFKSQR